LSRISRYKQLPAYNDTSITIGIKSYILALYRSVYELNTCEWNNHRMDEKGFISRTVSSDGSIIKNYDEALRFINEKRSLDEKIKNEQRSMNSKLMWKVDLCLIPIMCVIYFLQFLDKTLINYSAVMGIKQNLKGDEFSNLATIFYASYIFFEPLNSYLLQKLPLAKFLSTTIIAWGIILSCHAACHTYASLMIVRVLLGAFEGPVAVCLIAISGMYWNHKQQF